MRLLLILLTLVASTANSYLLNGQSERNDGEFNKLTLNEKKEVLIHELQRDTSKYSKEDIFHTAIGSQNMNPYSELYIINGKQYFKFDIVDRACVEEFIEKYLINSKLKSISKLSIDYSKALYGTLGKQGVTIIEVKNLKIIRTENCGFRESKNNRGSNLDQWKEGDIRIRN